MMTSLMAEHALWQSMPRGRTYLVLDAALSKLAGHIQSAIADEIVETLAQLRSCAGENADEG